MWDKIVQQPTYTRKDRLAEERMAWACLALIMWIIGWSMGRVC
jgi:hypothetical protein